MAVIMGGCQGRPKTPTITEKICPNCGSKRPETFDDLISIREKIKEVCERTC